jgi:NAD(P)-dependent dehydrogenase (short-subunit alcohol dehydrogenase family)
VSSRGHFYGSVRLSDYNFQEAPYEPFVAYGQSKTANIWMANEIERRYGTNGLHGISLHPGIIRTGLLKHLPVEVTQKLEIPQFIKYSKNVEQGAATSVYAAVSKDLEGKGAIWLSNCDQWGPGDGAQALNDGYSPYAFDEEGQKKLWQDSLKFVGIKDEA